MENENKPPEKTKKKKKNDLEKYDGRGVQTLFRTLSRNHYNLLKMVDNKARIVLTVNSIITSLLFGVLFMAKNNQEIKIEMNVRILVVCSMLSMIFALLSMLPHRYYGSAFKNSGYKGVLYAENFAALSLDEFKSEFKRIMKKGQNIYDEMIDDLYFLGKIIAMKQRLLLISASIFVIGLLGAIIYSLVFGLVSLS